MSILHILSGESYQIYHREIARFCGSVNAAILLDDLMSREKYHSTNAELTTHEKYGSGWFYYTMDKCEERTVLTRKEQDTAIKILKEKGLIEMQNFGLPAKRHFRINEDAVLSIFNLSKKHSSLTETDKLECPKGTNYNDRKGQTPHIYKEPKEEPYNTSSSGEVVADVQSLESEEEISKRSFEASAFIAKSSEGFGEEWKLTSQFFEVLMTKYGMKYTIDQLNYMIEQQRDFLSKSNKWVKGKEIKSPKSYMRHSCEKNWAMSIHKKK